MLQIVEDAFAKINLTLDIVGESQGFHLLDMLVCSIDISDSVKVTYRDDMMIECTMNGFIQDERNSAVIAAKLICDTFKTNGFNIEITKRIPMAGGLGGSTADGVAVVRAVQKMLDLPNNKIDNKWLLNIGSDAPCMYGKGLKRVRGRGEIIDNIDYDIPYNVGYVSKVAVDTKDAYRMFDKLKLGSMQSTERLLSNINKSNFDIADYLTNDLLIPAITLCPELLSNINELKSYNPKAVSMSGSGGTIYGLFDKQVPVFLNSTKFLK